MSDCIFCKIVNGEIPSTKVYEDGEILAFLDINPMAPVHVVLIPKAHVASSAAELTEENAGIVSRIFVAAANIAREKNLDAGYRVITNVGPAAGQTVPHLHFHLLGGRDLQTTLG